MAAAVPVAMMRDDSLTHNHIMYFMKNLFPVLLAVLLPACALSQRTAEHWLDTMPQVRYLAARFEQQKLSSLKLLGAIDFGQKLESRMGHVLCGDNKEPLVWMTEMAAVNYLAGFGWRLVAIEGGRYYFERLK